MVAYYIMDDDDDDDDDADADADADGDGDRDGDGDGDGDGDDDDDDELRGWTNFFEVGQTQRFNSNIGIESIFAHNCHILPCKK
eukprot:6470864-Amphidinium_carterae.1